MKSALVVLSGGQDSTTCLFWTIHQPEIEVVHAVTFDYGQRHKAEIEAAYAVCGRASDVFGKVIPHKVVNLGAIFEGMSPLTAIEHELETYSDIDEMNAVIENRIELTFVPGRNLIFLGLAGSYAVARGLEAVVTGICQADRANYPDCRRTFADSLEATLEQATANPVKIVTPLISMTKKESIRLAMSLPGCMDALAYSHTAYSGEYPPVTQDHATVLRAHGFEEAGVPDPLILRAWHEGLITELPPTKNYDVVRGAIRINEKPIQS